MMTMTDWEEKLEELQVKIKYVFKDTALLKRSLTTIPFAIENRLPENKHQEALRNLGDALIDVFIYEQAIKSGITRKGKADDRRQLLGNKDILKVFALGFELESYVRWGRGEIKQESWNAGKKVIGECLEALVGAIYLDSNIESAREVFWLIVPLRY